MLLLLNDLGEKLCHLLDFLYNKIRHRNGDQRLHFPISIGILILFVYILVCAIVLSVELEWDYVDSVYFMFLTFTTVGFGDIMPENPLNMLWIDEFLFVGLVLMSMIFNMINERLRDRYLKTTEEGENRNAQNDGINTE